MATYTPAKLVQSTATTSETTIYTAPASGTVTAVIVKEVVVANTSGSNVTYTLSLVPQGGSAGTGNRIIPGRTMAANDVQVFALNTVMSPSDFLSHLASATGITVTISGVKVV